MVAIVPAEEVADEGLCILDAAEALWELRLASSRRALALRALRSERENSRLTRLPSSKHVAWIAAPMHEKTCTLTGYPCEELPRASLAPFEALELPHHPRTQRLIDVA